MKATIVSVRLWISLFVLINTNKLSSTGAGEAIGVKILILCLMSANLVYHYLLWDYPCPVECGINRVVPTVRPSGTFPQEKKKNHHEPKVSNHS